MIMTWIGQEESQIMQGLINKMNCEMPNYVTDVYKARRSKYKNIKIWSKVDLGTCRVEDICITDGYYNPIPEFTILKYKSEEEPVENVSLENEEKTIVENPAKKLSLNDF